MTRFATPRRRRALLVFVPRPRARGRVPRRALAVVRHAGRSRVLQRTPEVVTQWGRTSERFNVHSIRNSLLSGLYETPGMAAMCPLRAWRSFDPCGWQHPLHPQRRGKLRLECIEDTRVGRLFASHSGAGFAGGYGYLWRERLRTVMELLRAPAARLAQGRASRLHL